jgi:hypothetical protein
MRFKFLKFVTVGLLTLVMLSPELVVISAVWEQHMQLVQTQQLACAINQSSVSHLPLVPQESTDLVQNSTHFKLFEVKFFQQLLTAAEKYRVFKILQWICFLFPISLGILIFLYDRYLVYRATVLKKRVAMLERLWRQNIEQ